jgi:hypothetical protein
MLPPKIERAQMGVGATEMWEGGLELLSSRQFFFLLRFPAISLRRPYLSPKSGPKSQSPSNLPLPSSQAAQIHPWQGARRRPSPPRKAGSASRPPCSSAPGMAAPSPDGWSLSLSFRFRCSLITNQILTAARPATRTSPSSSSTCTAAASTPRSG